ncbi:hypothetical protein F4802DRAFT_620636 [Xylaria palmicola]|nr:hypothetical protein F4802DRAFT_620636 [Xylaria palmicola]
MEPWQFGPMVRSLQFSDRGYIPGGHVQSLAGEAGIHRLIFETEKITVNEASWFPFFKQDRWFGTRSANPVLSGDQWTVDDPKVWKELRVSLELANRVLRTLIKDKHAFLQTMLFGKLAYWRDAALKIQGKDATNLEFSLPDWPNSLPEPFPGAKVLLSHAFYKERWTALFPDTPCNMDAILGFDEDAWTRRLESIASKQEWALSPLNNDPDQRISGVTFSTHGNIIIIDPVFLEALMNDNITLAERCTLLFFQANTILHELSHALMSTRMRIDTDPILTGLTKGDTNLTEPFIDFGGSAELGYALENAVFGGVLRDCSHRGPFSVLLGPHYKTWPFPTLSDASATMGSKVPGHPDFAAGVENRLIMIPALYFSRMLSESYWKDERNPRKSDHFFDRLDIFSARTPHQPGTSLRDYQRTPVIENREQIEDYRVRGLLKPAVADMIIEWEQRESLWKEIRAGWFEDEGIIWLMSPWGTTQARGHVSGFNKEARKDISQRDLFTAVFHANQLANIINWYSGGEAYRESLMEQSIPAVWHAVGLLMLAALPIRPEMCTRPATMLKMPHYMMPSSHAPHKAHKYITSNCPPPSSLAILGCARSEFFDPLGRDGRYFAYGEYTHLDYLDLVLKLINHWAMGGMPVSTPWLQEICRLEAKLRAQRVDQDVRQVLYRAGTWVQDWDFVVPPYDPYAESIWNPATSVWQDVNI